MLSSKLYSHPGRLLEDHLSGVSNLSTLFLAEKPINIKEEVTDIIRIIALTHDIGKATGYFQEYLKADEQEKESFKNKKETRHSLFSSVCAYYLTKEVKAESIYPFFAFLTVRRHHGNLRDVMDDVIFDSWDAEILHKQLESIDSKAFSVLSERLFTAGISLLLDKRIISQWIDDFVNESKQTKKKLRKINGEVSNYIILNLFYSILLDADKSDVVIKDSISFHRKELKNGDWVDNYKKKVTFPSSPINNLRERAYQEVVRRKTDRDNRIFSLNLPTGLGKTLTSLSFALKLRENLKLNRDNLNPRIIYALPFLSIIDQNSDVFESVIRMNDVDPGTDVLLKHHHLSEIFYKKDDCEFEPDEAKILIEGWNSEIIVTTFVQLFHTLLSNRNKSLRKFHRLANSIIILDEVQSIPIKYWLLLREVLLELSKILNIHVIFVTATEPLIFDREEVKDLVNRDFYFNSLDRVLLVPLLKVPMTLKDLSKYFNLNDEKAYLFIFNTITAAKDFYNLIKDKDVALTFLSTHIIPKERLKRIKEIRERKYKVVVSTQLVEAGVDIDCDVVVRDIAPMDSINQAAGRCNRNGNKKGIIYIVLLQDDNGKRYSSYVYDSVLLDMTKKILSAKEEIKESDFLIIIKDYYTETKGKKTQKISKDILEAITKLRYDSEDDKTSISDFRLIEETYSKRDIFIELDQDAHEVWNEYIKLKEIDNLFLRKNKFDAMKANFYQYMISVPANIDNIPIVYGELGYVKQSLLKDYYDEEIGFITKDTRTIVVW